MKVLRGHIFAGVAVTLLATYIVLSVLSLSHVLVIPSQTQGTLNVFAGFVIAAVGLSQWISKSGKSMREFWIVAISAIILAALLLFLLR
jgi:hypothetical protein